jgi:hypothetical protein
MFTDIREKKNNNSDKKTWDCFLGFLHSNKTPSTMACRPKTRIIVNSIGLEDVIG